VVVAVGQSNRVHGYASPKRRTGWSHSRLRIAASSTSSVLIVPSMPTLAVAPWTCHAEQHDERGDVPWRNPSSSLVTPTWRGTPSRGAIGGPPRPGTGRPA